MQSPSVSSVSTPSQFGMHHAHKRRALLITIIVVALLVVGWILYKRSVTAPTLTTEEQQSLILQHLEDANKNQIPAEQKTDILSGLEKTNTANVKAQSANKPVTSGPTDEQKSAILNSLAK